MTVIELPGSMSEADLLLLADDQALLDDLLANLSEEEAEALLWDWSFWRRPEQAAPAGPWDIWFVRAGRGFGKTRTGAETVRERVEKGLSKRIGLIAPTAADGRDVMVEGESGLLAVHPPWNRPKYEPSKRRITWDNGATATVYSADEPERLRGPQHDFVWGDEPASWIRAGADALSNARFGLRLGKHPQMLLTGTPKPLPWLRELWAEDGVLITTGSTFDNAHNLAAAFIRIMSGRYDGTRLGRQELHAEVLDDVEGALWTQQVIELGRMGPWDATNPWRCLNAWLAERGEPLVMNQRRMWRTIVAVDPPGSTAECGIAAMTAPVNGVAGRDHAVLLEDASMTGRPEEWGGAVVAAYRRVNAQAVYVEDNQGGDMARSTIHAVDPDVPVRKIHASESKKARAEPVAALYEKGWVHHAGFWTRLEDQMTTWVPSTTGGAGPKSPDRLDAVVHGVRELLKDRSGGRSRAGSAASRQL